jgi:hypothetical protein
MPDCTLTPVHEPAIPTTASVDRPPVRLHGNDGTCEEKCPLRRTGIHLSSPNGVRTRVSTLRGRNGSWHRSSSGPTESHRRSSKRPPSTTGGTICAIPERPGTDLLGGMLGFPVGADVAPRRTSATSVGTRDPVS